MIKVTPTFVELAVAFVLIVAASFLIYMFGHWASAKSVQTKNSKSAYACGEKVTFHKLRINVSLYKYLIYFVILDSSVLLVAFASLILQAASALPFMLYLMIVLVSGFLLFGGGD